MTTAGLIAKRILDIGASLGALVVLSPLLVVVAIAIVLDNPGPVFYRQNRWGKDKKPFRMFKFRSMRQESCDTGEGVVKQATKTDDRVTKVGRFIRKTSIDELPQLLNILLGDMSLVGPRPHAVAHNEYYQERINGYLDRHRMLPGLTGLAQVRGWRGETPTDDLMQARVDADNEYIENWRFWHDIDIIIRTFGLVFSGKNAH